MGLNQYAQLMRNLEIDDETIEYDVDKDKKHYYWRKCYFLNNWVKDNCELSTEFDQPHYLYKFKKGEEGIKQIKKLKKRTEKGLKELLKHKNKPYHIRDTKRDYEKNDIRKILEFCDWAIEQLKKGEEISYKVDLDYAGLERVAQSILKLKKKFDGRNIEYRELDSQYYEKLDKTVRNIIIKKHPGLKIRNLQHIPYKELNEELKDIAQDIMKKKFHYSNVEGYGLYLECNELKRNAQDILRLKKKFYDRNIEGYVFNNWVIYNGEPLNYYFHTPGRYAYKFKKGGKGIKQIKELKKISEDNNKPQHINETGRQYYEDHVKRDLEFCDWAIEQLKKGEEIIYNFDLGQYVQLKRNMKEGRYYSVGRDKKHYYWNKCYFLNDWVIDNCEPFNMSIQADDLYKFKKGEEGIKQIEELRKSSQKELQRLPKERREESEEIVKRAKELRELPEEEFQEGLKRLAENDYKKSKKGVGLFGFFKRKEEKDYKKSDDTIKSLVKRTIVFPEKNINDYKRGRGIRLAKKLKELSQEGFQEELKKLSEYFRTEYMKDYYEFDVNNIKRVFEFCDWAIGQLKKGEEIVYKQSQ